MADQASDSEPGFAALRHRMVETQIERRGITAPDVLNAMRRVPRHEFVAETLRGQAYADHPLPIGHDQTISQPFIVGSMTQELRLTPHSRVLEIGAGCGYQTAVLAEIVEHVFSIEVIPELVNKADERLRRLGYRNVSLKLGDGSHGWLDQAPFDGILVAAAAYRLPEAWTDQLAEGGRLILPLVSGDGYNQDLVLYHKVSGELTRRILYGVRFVPLYGSE